MDDGSVVIAPKPTGRELDDPAIASFLTFLERESSRPEALVPLLPELLNRGKVLIEGVEVDLDAPLADE